MSGDQSEEDKQYEPSQKKLDDARKKGEIPRSVDLTTAAAYGGLLVAAMVFGPNALINVGDTLQMLLDQSHSLAEVMFVGSPQPLMAGLMGTLIGALSPIFFLPAAFAMVSILGQRAFVIAPDKLKPKGSRISPIQGAKNKFGRNGMFEFTKSFVKLSIFSCVLGVFLYQRQDRMIGAMFLSPEMIAVEVLSLVISLLIIVLLVATSLGAIDYLWQKAEHSRKHRMSRKEMLDELKQSDGDPLMKQQRRQRGIDLAMNAMMADVPDANVVIVNPTHYAVALKWSPSDGTAPICVAKGSDEIAARIREIANRNNIPLHSDPPTARALHATVEIGQEVPAGHYKAVAAAIRFADKMRAKAVAAR